jgi:hypothetical protein
VGTVYTPPVNEMEVLPLETRVFSCIPWVVRVCMAPPERVSALSVIKTFPCILDVVSDPWALAISVVPRVRYCRVGAGPNCWRRRVEVAIEFEAVSHAVLKLEGTVAESPRIVRPCRRF